MGLSELDILSRIRSKSIKKKRIISCFFELTYLCNFDCSMCCVNMTRDEARGVGNALTKDEWIELARQAKEYGILTIVLTGGECMLNPDFQEIYTAIIRMGFQVYIMTNASLIKGDMLTLFAKHAPNGMTVSLYGSCQEAYSVITKSATAYADAIAGIENAQRLNIPLKINLTTTKDMIFDIPNRIEVARKYSYQINHNLFLSPHQRLPQKFDVTRYRIPPELRICIEMEGYRNIEQAAEKAKALNARCEQMQFPFVWGKPGEHEPLKLDACNGSYMMRYITWDGMMFVCATYQSAGANVRELGFSGANEYITNQHSKAFLEIENCRRCEYRAYCNDRCQGHFYSESVQTNTVYDYACRYAYSKYMYRELFMDKGGGLA